MNADIIFESIDLTQLLISLHPYLYATKLLSKINSFIISFQVYSSSFILIKTCRNCRYILIVIFYWRRRFIINHSTGSNHIEIDSGWQLTGSKKAEKEKRNITEMCIYLHIYVCVSGKSSFSKHKYTCERFSELNTTSGITDVYIILIYTLYSLRFCHWAIIVHTMYYECSSWNWSSFGWVSYILQDTWHWKGCVSQIDSVPCFNIAIV